MKRKKIFAISIIMVCFGLITFGGIKLSDNPNIAFADESSIMPSIQIDVTEGWAKKVNVTINWNIADISYRHFKVINKITEIEIYSENITSTDYGITSKFEVTTQSKIEVQAHYLNANKNQVFVSKEFECIDATSPSYTIMEETFRIFIDLRSDIPASASLMVKDVPSGVKSVNFRYEDVAFDRVSDNKYQGNIMDRPSFWIRATDFAGNYTDFHYVTTLNFATIKKYSEIYKSIVWNDYNSKVADLIEQEFSTLNITLANDDASSSEIFQITHKIDNLLSTKLTKNVIIKNPSSLANNSVTYAIDESKLLEDYKKGDVISLIIDASKVDLSGFITQAKLKTEFKDSISYAFNLSMVLNNVDITVTLQSKVDLSIPLRKEYANNKAKIFKVKDGDLQEIDVNIEDGVFNFSDATLGDYIIVVDLPKQKGVRIFGKIISASTFVGVICGGVAFFVVACVTITIILKKKEKGSR